MLFCPQKRRYHLLIAWRIDLVMADFQYVDKMILDQEFEAAIDSNQTGKKARHSRLLNAT